MLRSRCSKSASNRLLIWAFATPARWGQCRGGAAAAGAAERPVPHLPEARSRNQNLVSLAISPDPLLGSSLTQTDGRSNLLATPHPREEQGKGENPHRRPRAVIHHDCPLRGLRFPVGDLPRRGLQLSRAPDLSRDDVGIKLGGGSSITKEIPTKMRHTYQIGTRKTSTVLRLKDAKPRSRRLISDETGAAPPAFRGSATSRCWASVLLPMTHQQDRDRAPHHPRLARTLVRPDARTTSLPRYRGSSSGGPLGRLLAVLLRSAPARRAHIFRLRRRRATRRRTIVPFGGVQPQ